MILSDESLRILYHENEFIKLHIWEEISRGDGWIQKEINLLWYAYLKTQLFNYSSKGLAEGNM